MGWDRRLAGLDLDELNSIFKHPEHLANVRVVAGLLEQCDAAGHSGDELHEVQRRLFGSSYRAQMAAQQIGRAWQRVYDLKDPGWPGTLDARTSTLASPQWQLQCDPRSREEKDWRLERQVAERVIRQLRAVGDVLAWRVYEYDRRAIVALSRAQMPGPFVGKEGLDSEIAKVSEIKENHGNFALMHDLTSVLRVLDLTEVRTDGSRMLREVKSSTSASSMAKARKQYRRAERLLAAIDGSQPLPGDEATFLWRSTTQLRTHVRETGSLFEQAERHGFATARIADRVIGVIHAFSAARADRPEDAWSAYAQARDRLLDRHLGLERGMHRLRAISADTTARDPATAPWGIYPLPARHRAALICDYLVVESFMMADTIAARFRRRGLHTQVLLSPARGEFNTRTSVLRVTDASRGMVIHGSAVYQMLMEFILTDRFVTTACEVLRLPHPPRHALHIHSNERAAWR